MYLYNFISFSSDVKYFWDEDKKEWKVSEEKESVKTIIEDPKIVEEKEENEDNFDPKKPKEIAKQDMTKGQYGYENNTHIYTDPSDGTKYFWDKEKNAWFPKVCL